jgi:O-antigen ligase
VPSESQSFPRRKHNAPPPLPWAERWLLGIVVLHLCFLPWALGDMHPWSQEISFALAVVGFVTALLPRRGPIREKGDEEPNSCEFGYRRIHCPAFWLGAVFLLYILIQALNPAWRYVLSDSAWWMTRIPHVAWLPHGMITPFAIASPWRCLMIDSSAWLVVCSIWVGFTRRRSLRILFLALAANAAALTILGLLERALGAQQIYWFWQPPQPYFVSSFIYKNHAGAYFDLLLGVCCGLIAWHSVRARARFKGTNPWAALVATALMIVFIVLFSYSRAATLLMMAFIMLCPLLLLKTRVLPANHRLRHLFFGLFYGGFAIFIAGSLCFMSGEEVVSRMELMFNRYAPGQMALRPVVAQATFDMFRADPVYGWGADCFRFGFPVFQQNYPYIYRETGQNLRRYYWEHAHNDYAEFLAEFGLVGAALAVAMLAHWARALVRWRFWRNPCTALAAPACLLTLIHAAGDFPFHNPAVLVTWCALLPALVLWTKWESA